MYINPIKTVKILSEMVERKYRRFDTEETNHQNHLCAEMLFQFLEKQLSQFTEIFEGNGVIVK
jgi:hypothetical protein